jgi:hypothetical protein
MLVGLLFAMFEKFRIGRGVEIAILVVAALVSFLTPIGIVM